VRQLYFQNPKSGFYFLQLASERLTRVARQAGVVAPRVLIESSP
jgi:hypothetical protein